MKKQPLTGLKGIVFSFSSLHRHRIVERKRRMRNHALYGSLAPFMPTKQTLQIRLSIDGRV